MVFNLRHPWELKYGGINEAIQGYSRDIGRPKLCPMLQWSNQQRVMPKLMFLPIRRTMLEGFIKKILLVMLKERNMLEEITKNVLLQTRKKVMVVEGRKSFTTDSLWMKVRLITGHSVSEYGFQGLKTYQAPAST